MVDRRKFIQITGSSLLTLSPITRILTKTTDEFSPRLLEDFPIDKSINDEDFWYQVRMAYTVSPSIINLNNGGVSPAPKIVQDALDRYNKLCNEAPSYYMWRILDQGREPLREKLANLAGCSPEEIAINRNATESLETIIFGLRLQKGDEIVLSKQDYPNMINAWKQREHRDGIVLKWIDLPLPMEDKNEIVKYYTEAFTAKTKIVHITHVINWVGQIIPAKEIADVAHKHGIEVLLDGAHSFVHIGFKLSEIGCDYFGTSLHKWLSAPIGSGFMFVKKDKIKNLYPLFGAGEPESEDIRKFENLGTRSFAIEQGISEAIDFHNMLGMERKEKRLKYLKNYWVDKVKDMPKISFNTPLKDEFSCAICNVKIEGMKPEELDSKLFGQYKIHTVGINWENIHGVRITPNVYTLTSELDKLVKALREIAS